MMMNNPAIQIGENKVYSGHNLDILRTFDDNSVHSIVTDPPYELGFMGKGWDKSGIAYSVELWKECLRVLKPGGHLLAFGGSRTWHRLAVAIEDAGFEMRDSIAWLYGSGFPKSLDISKAIDKSYGENKARQLQFVNWMRSTGITAKQINEATGTKMSSHYIGLSQPTIATADLFDKLRPYLPEVPEEIERLVAERTGIEWTAYKNREVIGAKITGAAMTSNKSENSATNFGSGQNVVDITAPATPEAKKWDGWGTALKPAFEPIVVARKPLIGTVAENVLQFGTGGLNIDATRIAGAVPNVPQPALGVREGITYSFGTGKGRNGEMSNNTSGRWPANVILDETTAELLDEQTGITKSVAGGKSGTSFSAGVQGIARTDERIGHTDSGGASRFFYVAKASKRDRNEGLENIEGKEIGAKGNGLARTCNTCGATVLDGCDCPDRTFSNPVRQNFHPTVKPTTLMTYLIKLVTPPTGIVLDPFAGSGSTGKAAILEGYKFVGIELTEDYLPIIEGRLQHAYQTYLDKGDDLFA